MISAKAVEANNFVTYDHARFEFKPGVSVIRGQNRSGKSLLFAGIPNLRFGSPIMATGRGGGTMFTRPNGSFQFEFDHGKTPVVIRQFVGKGKTAKYSISIDGKDQEVDTQKAAFALMAEWLPGTEDLFSTTVYLTALKANPMQGGSGAQRMEYLEKLFDMASVDTLREKIKTMLEKSKRAMVELEALKAEYEAIEKPDPRLDRMARYLKHAIEDGEVYLDYRDRLKRRESEARTLREGLNFSSAHPKRLKTMKKQAEAELVSVYKKLERLKAAQRASHDAAVVRKQVAQLNRRRADAAKHLKALAAKHGHEIFHELDREGLDSHQLDLMKLSNLLTEIKGHRRNYVKLRKIIARFDARQAKTPRRIRRFIKQADASVTRLAPYVKLIEHLHEHDSGSCPTCMRNFSKDELKANIDLMEEYRMAKRVLRAIEAPVGLQYAADDPPSVDTVRKLKADVQALEKKISALRVYLSFDEIVRSCEEELLALGPVTDAEEVDHEQDIAQLSAVAQGVKDRLSRINDDLDTHRKIRNVMKQVDPPPPSPMTHGAMQRALVMHGAIDQKADRARRDRSRRLEIEDRMKKLARLVEHDDVLSALYAAYGPRGLRVNQMADMADLLEGSFNDHARQFFPESMYFQFDVAPSRVDVQVQRNSLSGAASLMSGSESRLFQLLCMASVMEYLPKKFRWDTVILDEIESNMEDVTRSFLVEKCLPHIISAVDKVNIITPLSEDEFFIGGGEGYDVHEYRVTKARGRSSIGAV